MKVHRSVMNASQKIRPQRIYHHVELDHIKPGYAVLVAVCIFTLPILAAEHVQLATMCHMNTIEQCGHPCHRAFVYTPLVLPRLDNILPLLILQNRVTWLNVKFHSQYSSHSSVDRVSPSPSLVIPSARMVVGVIVMLLLIISGDIESNPGPITTRLEPDDLRDLRVLLRDVSAYWVNIADQLKMQSEVENIRRSPHNVEPSDFLRNLLFIWLNQDPTPTLDTLCHALRADADIIGGYRVATNLEEKFRSRKGSESQPAAKRMRSDDYHVQSQGPAEGLLEEMSETLRCDYQSQPEVQEDCWPPVKKSHFVDLALLKNESIDFSNDFTRQTVRGSVDEDDIIKAKERVDYSGIFERLKAGSRILLEGRPGSGKTTLMNKISRDWAQGAILKGLVSLFILIPLRRLHSGVEVTLKTLLSIIPHSKACELCRYIEHCNGEGVCFALDGLDEFSSRKENDFVCQLIERHQLPKAIVIVSSRPKAIQKFRRGADQDVEVLGFPKEQIEKYISDNVESNEMAKNMKLYLDHHPNIMHMCYLPIHMAIITFLFNVLGSNLPETETEIYKQFTLQTLIKALLKSMKEDEPNVTLKRFEDLPLKEHQLFLNICELALAATKNKEQGFNHEDVEQFFTLTKQHEMDMALGLLTVDRQATLYGLTNTYSFLHLTFQEFLAACHLTTLSKEKQEQFISTYHQQPHMEVVIKFYCGLTKLKDDTALRSFLSTIHGGPVCTRLHLHCAFESQNEVATQALVSAGSGTLHLKKENLTASDCTAISFVINKCGGQLQNLTLWRCHIGSEGLETLAKLASRNLSCLKTLDLHGCFIEDSGATALAQCLKFCSNLQKLDLSYNGIHSERCVSISRSLQECRELRNLSLESNNIGAEGCATLARALQECRQLQQLNLGSNNIGAEGCATLARALQECRQLQQLHLGSNNIGAEGCATLARALQECRQLQQLNLRHNNIGDEGCATLARALQECRQLQQLNLGSNYIGDEGCATLARVLQECRQLQQLDLSTNFIGDEGCATLARALQECRQLQQLYLSTNFIGAEGCATLARALQECRQLQQLYLDWNDIGAEGCATLARALQECRQLQQLYLSWNSLTDGSVISISELIKTAKSLKELRTYYNKFTEEGEAQLRQAAEERKNYPDFVVLDLIINV